MPLAVAEERRLRVLLVDDSMDEGLLLEAAALRSRLPIDVASQRDPVAALRSLQGMGTDALPDVLLVDVNMPVLDGPGFLDLLRDGRDAVAYLPAVAYSTSDRVEDVDAMYRRRCAGFIVKPTTFDDTLEMVRTLFAYWCRTVRLPTTP